MIRLVLEMFIILTAVKAMLPETDYHQYLADYGVSVLTDECKNCGTVLIVDTKHNYASQLFANRVMEIYPNVAFFTVVLDNYTFVEQGTYMGYHPDMTFIFLNKGNHLEIEDVIYGLESSKLWNIRGKFVVIGEAIETELDLAWIRDFFDAFWYRHAPHALLCIWNEHLIVYSYNPFLNDFAIDITNNSKMLATLFSDVTNLHGTPLKFYNFDYLVNVRAQWLTKEDGTGSWVGADGLFFETVAHAMNGYVEVHNLSEDFSYEAVNGADLSLSVNQFMSIFKELYNFDALLVAGRYLGESDVDIICLYEKNDLYILVPTSHQIPQYLYIFLIVSVKVWCATLTCLVAVSMAMIIFQKFDLDKKPDVLKIFMENYRLLLNESIPDRHRRPEDRLVFILWVYFCLIFSTLFQTILMTVLVDPKYYAEIDTLEELYKTDIKVSVAELLKRQLAQKISEESPQLFQHIIALPRHITSFGESMDWIYNFSFSNNSGIIISKEQIYHLKQKDKNLVRLPFHVVKESVMPIPMVYSIRRDKFFYKEFVDLYGRIQAAGLNIHWSRFNYGNKQTITADTDTALTDTNELILGIDNLQSAFMILILGYLVSFTVFTFELLIPYCKSG